MRSDAEFVKLWTSSVDQAVILDVGASVLQRQGKIPSRFDDNSGNAHIFESAECHYRRLFFNLVDTALMEVEKRFNQESFLSKRS